jgi:hypothetical protein
MLRCFHDHILIYSCPSSWSNKKSGMFVSKSSMFREDTRTPGALADGREGKGCNG